MSVTESVIEKEGNVSVRENRHRDDQQKENVNLNAKEKENVNGEKTIQRIVQGIEKS